MVTGVRRSQLLTTDARILVLIALDPNVSIAQLARRAHVSPRHITRILGRLEKAGYISRKPSTSTRALYTIHIESPIEESPVRTTLQALLTALTGPGDSR